MAKLSTLIKGYKGDMNKVYVQSCLELSARVQGATPVDTSRAKQGWSNNGAPSLFRTFSYLNNVEYIIPLEYGHSDQAPNGMLRVNVRNWNSIVRGNL